MFSAGLALKKHNICKILSVRLHCILFVNKEYHFFSLVATAMVKIWLFMITLKNKYQFYINIQQFFPFLYLSPLLTWRLTKRV